MVNLYKRNNQCCVEKLVVINYLNSENKELRAALVECQEALNIAEWSTGKLEEFGRMAGCTDADLLIGKETVFSKALTRCKEILK